MWKGVYTKRFQYWPPWECTFWYRPTLPVRGSDEYHNSSILIGLGLLGSLVFFKPFGKMQDAWSSQRCEECFRDDIYRVDSRERHAPLPEKDSRWTWDYNKRVRVMDTQWRKARWYVQICQVGPRKEIERPGLHWVDLSRFWELAEDESL